DRGATGACGGTAHLREPGTALLLPPLPPAVRRSAGTLSRVMDEATEHAQRRWDEQASGYDRGMRIFERLLFRGGRDWVCAQARRDVLEIAVGTGLNLTHYPRDARLTGIELSQMMLEIARQRLRTWGVRATCASGTPKLSNFRMAASI